MDDTKIEIPLPNEVTVYSANLYKWEQGSDLVSGIADLTNFRVLFSPLDAECNQPPFSAMIPYGNIEKVTSGSTVRGPTIYSYIELTLKQFSSIKFLSEIETEEFKKFKEEVKKIAFPLSNKMPHPAFSYKEDHKSDGWDIFDTVTEYKRMGIPNDLWRISSVNETFSFCDTYPKYLIVPATVNDEMLQAFKEFRSKNRAPVLSWVHPKNQCSITRCSQPMTAAFKRNKEDESYIQSIKDASPSCHNLVIFDARPAINAASNQVIGGGYENVKHYNNATLVFLDIPNIHAIRESLKKLRDLCITNYNSPDWFSLLDNTKWLEHIGKILSGAVKIAENIDRNRTSVVVHCSDGWDRTPQLTSLAMICLDPFYRTVVGFETLIEKEWCDFGHKFKQRYGIGDDNFSDEQRSPTFNQFLDCVWQILNQYPCAFEYTENLLLKTLSLMNTGWYGSFMYDTVCLREKNNVRGTTVSVWSAINSRPDLILNPFYCKERFQKVILPVPTIPYLKLWKSCYFKNNSLIKPKMNYESIYSLVMEKKMICSDMVNRMKEEIEEMNTRVKKMTI